MSTLQQTAVVTAPTGDYRITRQWAHGLCGCFDNCGICIIAFCLPCITFGQTAEGLGKSCCCYGCLYLCWPIGWCLEANQRREIRNVRGIPGGCITDMCLTLWCPLCTLVQEMQEVEQIKADERHHLGGAPVVVVNTNTTTQQPLQAIPPPHLQGYDQGAYNPPAYSAGDVTVNMKRE